ncbi:MAG: TonB-dependent receptor, partial [Bacteroidetes bacterium]|nr:TonB-dependent receptor [Bacteroidota bacterium]
MRRRNLLPALLCLLFINVYAQDKQGKITGTIVDGSQKNMASATITLINAKDSSVVKFTSSTKEGNYEFDHVSEGRFFVQVTIIGYEKANSDAIVISSANQLVKVPEIKLTEESKSLEAVTVTAKKPFIETKIDKTVVNVDASPTSAGSTAMEVLEKSPGISVDNDGNISLRGKAGVIVMMDGKPTYLSASDLATMLKNMPASALDQIEIMTNPSSKYDAAGNSGIINIKTKKGKQAGFNGSVMTSMTTSFLQLGN